MNDFYQDSAKTLENITEFFESSWPNADVDLLDGTITVNLPPAHQYIINTHNVTRQIWVSSPFTGAHHFHLNEGFWKCTRTHTRLEDFLLSERNAYAS